MTTRQTRVRRDLSTECPPLGCELLADAPTIPPRELRRRYRCVRDRHFDGAWLTAAVRQVLAEKSCFAASTQHSMDGAARVAWGREEGRRRLGLWCVQCPSSM